MTEPTAKFSFRRALDFCIRQTMRNSVKTMIPGIVQKYDKTTKRCNVLPAIKRTLADDSTISRPLLLDIPVIAPATGGVMMHQPLVEGDIVMLLFSERGLSQFKETWEESEADPGHYFNAMDAVAVRWGVETMEPVDDEAFVIQSKSGNTYFKLKEGEIELAVGDVKLKMDDKKGQFL